MLPSPSSRRRASFPSYALVSLSKTTTNMRSIVISCFEFELLSEPYLIRVRGSSVFPTESTAVHTADNAEACFPSFHKLRGSAPHRDPRVVRAQGPARARVFFRQSVLS